MIDEYSGISIRSTSTASTTTSTGSAGYSDTSFAELLTGSDDDDSSTTTTSAWTPDLTTLSSDLFVAMFSAEDGSSIATSLSDATQSFSDELTAALEEAGLDSSQNFTLSVAADGSIEVEGGEDADAVEQVFADNTELASSYRDLAAASDVAAQMRMAGKYSQQGATAGTSDAEIDLSQLWSLSQSMMQQASSSSSSKTQGVMSFDSGTVSAVQYAWA